MNRLGVHEEQPTHPMVMYTLPWQLLVSYVFTSQVVFLNVIFACLQHQDVESSVPDLSGIVDAVVNVASTMGISHIEVHLLEYL